MQKAQRDALKELLTSALVAIRDMAIIKKDKNATLCFYASRDNLIKIASKHSLRKILDIYDAIEKGLCDFGSNSNVPNTLTSILINAKKKGN